MTFRVKDAIMVIIIIIVSYIAIIQTREISRQQTKLKSQTVVVDTWTDKYNQSNAKVERIEGDLKTINELYKVTVDTVETLTNKLKRKEVTNYERIDAVVVNHIETDTIMVDGVVKLEYSDQFTTITGSLSDKFIIDIETSVPIHMMTYKEKVGFFKRKTVVHAVSINPAVTLTGISSLAVVEKKKRFGVGAQVGMSYIDGNFTPYIGLGLSYNFIRF